MNQEENNRLLTILQKPGMFLHKWPSTKFNHWWIADATGSCDIIWSSNLGEHPALFGLEIQDRRTSKGDKWIVYRTRYNPPEPMPVEDE